MCNRLYDAESENEYICASNEEPGRADVAAACLFGISRSQAAAKIAGGEILLDGICCKPAQKIAAGRRLSMLISPPSPIDLTPQDIAIDIVYQDSDIAVINKQQGLVVHPAAGNESGTLVNALMFHIKDLAGIGGELRPGIVHRIDKDTSGLLVVAKNTAAHIHLAGQIASRDMKRIYAAIVSGYPSGSGRIDAPIARDKNNRKRMAVDPAGRTAVTHYRVLEAFKGYSLIEATLDTGRTHQIRVHMKHIGHPVVGDAVYGGTTVLGLTEQALHAKELSFFHPSRGDRMTFTAQPPENFMRCIDKLRAEALER